MDWTIIETIEDNIDNLKSIKQDLKDAINIDFDLVTDEKLEDYATLIEAAEALYKARIPEEEEP